MNLNRDNVDLITDKVDWITNKQGSKLVMSFLLIIILILAGIVVKSEYSDNKRYEDLRLRVAECTKIKDDNTTLIIENSQLKINLVLAKALKDYEPTPKWLTDREGKVLWVNKAYVKKYLTPKGFSEKDLINTNGSHIFGESDALMFVNNNNTVLRENRPITFKEFEQTTKYPVPVGEYIFAVGGTEYQYFKL